MSTDSLFYDNYECHSLEWDTELFKIPCARVILKHAITTQEQSQILDFCNQYLFITIINEGNESFNNVWLGSLSQAFLADINVQFINSLEHNEELINHECHVIQRFPYNDDVVRIAKSSFHSSRFYNDPHLLPSQADKVYEKWVSNAFDHEHKYFVVAEVSGLIKGFILFSIKENCAVIELIGVDADNRRQKLGQSMIHTVFKFAKENSLSSVKVGTQINNTQAIRFYIDNSFMFVGSNSVYHYWPTGDHK